MAYSRCFPSDSDIFNDQGGVFPGMSSCMRELESYGDVIRKHMRDVDFARVLFVRSRRMVLLSVALMEQHIKQYGHWIKFFDSFVQIFALYHALVLLPRFWMNTLYVFNHIDDETLLEMQTRLWEMAYDFGWLVTSVLSFFVFVGPLAPCALFLTVATPTYHLLMHLIRMTLELSQGKTLEHDYADLMPLMVSIGVSVCVVSAAVVILLCCTNPILAFAAAAVAVLATIAGRYFPDYLVQEDLKQASTTSFIEHSIFNKQADTEGQSCDNPVDLVASEDRPV